MFELLSAVGQYIAIIALCATSWAIGRSSRSLDWHPADEDPLIARMWADQGGHLGLTQGWDPFLIVDGQSGEPAARKGWASPEERLISLRASAIYDLICTGDLSKDGVLESLVAMAEEHSVSLEMEEREAWSSTIGPLLDSHACAEPRILTRKTFAAEPLPAEKADPLTPEVLTRYRLYAEECSPLG